MPPIILSRLDRNLAWFKGRHGSIAKTTGYYAAFVALGMAGASLGPTLPDLAANTGTLLGEISFLFSARSLGYLLGSFLGGHLYDRVPGHPVMAMTLVVITVSMALVPLMSVLWILTTILLFIGVAEGTLDVGGNTLLVWVHGDQVGPFMNGLHFFFGVGAFLSPIIVAQTMSVSDDVRWAYWVLALLILPVAVWLLRLPGPTSRSDSRDAAAGAKDHDPDRARGQLLIFLVALFFFLYAGAEIGFGGWIFTYAVESGLSGETVAAYLTSAFWGALTLGRLVAIPIATRFRPRVILLADLAGALTSVGVTLLGSHSLTMTLVGAVGLGFSMASIFPTTLSLAERRLTITGRVTGWFFVGASSGGMTLPWVIGQLFEAAGPHTMMLAILIDLIMVTGVFAVLILHSAKLAKD